MRIESLLIAGVLAVAVAAQVQAQQPEAPQQWGVNDTPETSTDGRETSCTLWYGRSPQPLVQVRLTSAESRLNLGSAELAGGAGGRVPVEVRFPRGQTVNIGGGHGDGVVSIGLTEAALERTLDELQHNGDLVIAVSGHRFTFPVNNIARGVEYLRSCRRQLTETEAYAPIAQQDLDCAAHYRTLVSVQPSLVSLAIQRSAGAMQAYKANPPPATSGPTPVTDGEILAEIAARSGPRVQRIASGQEKPEALVADVHACDAQYGHEPLKLQ